MPHPIGVSKDSFDAALLPGVREQLAKVYGSLRQSEREIFKSVLDEQGVFRDGITHTRNCPCCEARWEDATTVYTVHGMHILQCRRCELVYSREVINRQADDARYRQSNAMNMHMALHVNEAYAGLESAKARYIVECLRTIVRGNVVSLLDIGCSTGSILKAATAIGWKAVGIDLNGKAVKIARDQGFNALAGGFPQDLPAGIGPFTVVTMLDVLEHAEDPVEFLESVSKCLTPNGLIAVQVPNLNSLLIRIEGTRNNNICHGHWTYFTPETLKKVAVKAGLETLTLETYISEIDRILAHPPEEVIQAARVLTGKKVEIADVHAGWIHKQLLGYKIFVILSRALTKGSSAS